MPWSRAIALEAARDVLELPLAELWLDYLSLGGSLAPATLRSALSGTVVLADHDHDVLVQALNERFGDRDQDHPLAYADELPSEV